MLDRLHLDLSPDELKRVWHMILKESGEAEAATGIHLNGFRHGVEHVAFLRHMVINLKEASGPEVQQYVVPASGAKGPPPPSEDSAPSATLEARGASLRRLSSLGSSPQLAPKMASCRYRAPGVRGLRLRPLDQRQLSRRWYTAPSRSMHVGPPARRLAPAPSLARRPSPQAAPRARSWSMASMESTRTSARRATTSTTSITPRRGGAAGSRRALPAPVERRAS